jgi:site-specific recombinase XerD
MSAYGEFFEPEFEDDNTHRSYRHTVHRFLAWCEDHDWEFKQVNPEAVAAYLRSLSTEKEMQRRRRPRDSTLWPESPSYKSPG